MGWIIAIMLCIAAVIFGKKTIKNYIDRRRFQRQKIFYNELSQKLTKARKQAFQKFNNKSSYKKADHSWLVRLVRETAERISLELHQSELLSKHSDDQKSDVRSLLFGFYLLMAHMALFEELGEEEISLVEKKFFKVVKEEEPDADLYISYLQEMVRWAGENPFKSDLWGMNDRLHGQTPHQDTIISAPAFGLTTGAGIDDLALEFKISSMLMEPLAQGSFYSDMQKALAGS